MPRPVEPERSREVDRARGDVRDATSPSERRSSRRSSAWPTRSASRLRSADRVARTVQLKVRYGDFRTITRSRTIAEPTDVALEIARTRCSCCGAVELGDGVRLLGSDRAAARGRRRGADEPPVRRHASPAPIMGGSAHEQRRRLEQSVDEVRDRYGDDAVVPARFAQPGARPPSSAAMKRR